jgi:hypothetical protein
MNIGWEKRSKNKESDNNKKRGMRCKKDDVELQRREGKEVHRVDFLADCMKFRKSSQYAKMQCDCSRNRHVSE